MAIFCFLTPINAAKLGKGKGYTAFKFNFIVILRAVYIFINTHRRFVFKCFNIKYIYAVFIFTADNFKMFTVYIPYITIYFCIECQFYISIGTNGIFNCRKFIFLKA